MARTQIVMSMLDLHRDRFFDSQAMDKLATLGDLSVDPDPEHHASEESQRLLSKANIIITGWGTGSLDPLAESLPNLKLLVHSGGTVRAITSEDIFDRGVRVCAQTDINAIPVAEYTVAMIILAAKDVFSSSRAYKDQRAKPDSFWDPFQHIGLYGCNIGIIGLSRISRKVIELLRPFNVNIKVQSSHLSVEQASRLGVTTASLEEVLSTSDVISLHTALTPKTRGMLTAEHFAMIPDHATFINTARGALCDQDALIAELLKDRFNAIIDVTYPEVNPPDSPLWTLPNVFLTPHAAGSMGRELKHLGNGAVQDIENYLLNRPPAGEFTKEQYAGRA